MSKKHHIADSVDRDSKNADAYNAGYASGLELGGNATPPDEYDEQESEHYISGFADGRAQ